MKHKIFQHVSANTENRSGLAVFQSPLALGTASAAMMITQIVLNRVLSIFLHYYFVYILMSIAILGLGFGALFTYLYEKRVRKFNPAFFLLGAGLVTSLITVLFAAVLSERLWFIYLLLSGFIFFLAGAFTSSIFRREGEKSSVLYWADLTGAALGVGIAVLIMNQTGGINALFSATLIWFLSGLIYSNKKNFFSISAALILVVLLLNLSFNLFDIAIDGTHTSKTIAVALDPAGLGGKITYTYWDAYARTDVVAYPNHVEEQTIFVDGGAGSPVFKGSDGLENLAFLRKDLGYIPFSIFEPENVLIIGPGGGKDIILAQLAEINDITAVEINPGILNALDSLSDFSGNFHRHPSVTLIVADGRSFVNSHQESYELINLSLVANEASDLAGMALSENYLYTKEAFDEYMASLKPDGLLAIRLHDEPHLQRAFTTALLSLVSNGLSTSEAMQHIIILSAPPHPASPALMDPLLMVFASPIQMAGAKELHQSLTGTNIIPLFIPGAAENMPYAAFSQGGLDIETYISRLSNNSYAKPTTDNRPFFYMLEGDLPRELMILFLIIGSLVVTWSIYMIVINKKQTKNFRNFSLPKLWWVYFALTGFGFMLIEINLLQRFNLFLGHPVRSLSIVLGSLLISTGIGSFISNWFALRDFKKIVRSAITGFLIIGLLYLAFLPQLFKVLQGNSLTHRIFVSILLIFPLGFLLGIPFPMGLRILSTKKVKILIPLALATNGIFSVLGSVLSMMIAIQTGYVSIWITGLAAYLALTILFWGPLKWFA